MTNDTVYIGGAGVISSLGSGLAATEQALWANQSAIKPLESFALLQGEPLPVGMVHGLEANTSLPRTHRLALAAAKQALVGVKNPPEAIIIGTTTGGIEHTERLLRRGEQTKELYRYHGLHSVAEYVAGAIGCTGTALTVSTACSSGAVALAVGLAMLRSGRVKTVLVGGADALCRLTYFGFFSLQLVDRNGCKPLDMGRQGMAVAEGAGMLYLTTEKPPQPLAELLGAGLSCDAYHAAAPHPDGQGAYAAMAGALSDAGLQPEDIGYINLHGTGTVDNDLAESKAVRRLFPLPPPLSSIKGASGHSLAASGAIEAVVATIAVSRGLLPANTGLQTVDPALGLAPLLRPLVGSAKAVLSNSFGFGGNNGSVVIGAVDAFATQQRARPTKGFTVQGCACLTGAGDRAATLARLQDGNFIAGRVDVEALAAHLPVQLIRRLKRLPRITLALAAMAHAASGPDAAKPGSVFMGTGWGALSETYDFLSRLTSSEEKFPSPTDFVGSVHNAPASQAAILFGATGPNITTSGGDYSFEQALLAADLMDRDRHRPALLLGADEGHDSFSALLDASIGADSTLIDGGAAFCLGREPEEGKCRLTVPFYQSCRAPGVVSGLVAALAAGRQGQGGYALILVGIPAAMREQGEQQLAFLMTTGKLEAPVIRYRHFTGEFTSASAVAVALAVSFLESGTVPGAIAGGDDLVLAAPAATILVLGLGQNITAMEIFRP